MIVDYMGECKPPSDGDLAEVSAFICSFYFLIATHRQTDKSKANIHPGNNFSFCRE